MSRLNPASSERSVPVRRGARRGRAILHAASAITITALLATAPAPSAQPRDGEPAATDADALGYYTIDAEPVRASAELVGPGRFSGFVPLAIPGDITGSFQLDLSAQGYADQRVRVDFPGGAAPLSWRSPRPTHAGGWAKALAWPGLAELTGGTGDDYRGRCFAAAGGAGVIGVITAAIRQGSAEDDLALTLESEVDSPSERADLALAAAQQGATADAANEAIHDWTFFAATAWGVALLDTYLLTPGPGRLTDDLTELRFEMEPLSRSEALLRSLVPGLGQFYSGRRTAGQVAFFASLVATSGLLMAEHSYDEAAHTAAAYEALYHDPLADPEQVAIYRTALEDAGETADSRHTTRNIMGAITAGVWIANLADAFFGVPERDDGERAGESGDDLPAPGLRLGVRPHVSWPEHAPGVALAIRF